MVSPSAAMSLRRKPTHPVLIVEENCPQCGQPMLRGWGATCGQCRSPLGHARAAHLIKAARAGQPSMTLGWVVVLDGPDEGRWGAALPIESAVTTITRQGAEAGLPGEVVLRDDFLSAGHALIKLAPDGDEASFTLEDRRDPAPSANGTFLNGRRLAPAELAPLCDGDEIRVGSTELVFRTLFIPGGP
jgi:hypothetical protein